MVKLQVRIHYREPHDFTTAINFKCSQINKSGILGPSSICIGHDNKTIIPIYIACNTLWVVIVCLASCKIMLSNTVTSYERYVKESKDIFWRIYVTINEKQMIYNVVIHIVLCLSEIQISKYCSMVVWLQSSKVFIFD